MVDPEDRGPVFDGVRIGLPATGALLDAGYRAIADLPSDLDSPAPDSPLDWCNPSGRALGTPPTAATAGAHADAYLWIKRPGESDGSCGRGEPSAGRFMNQYAIDLARNAGQ